MKSKEIVCEYLFYRYRNSDSIRWVKIPLVEVRMKSSAVEYGSVALVDSGSDRTFVSRDEAQLLGLKPRTNRDGTPITSEAIGAGATFVCDIMILPEMWVMRHGEPFQDFHGMTVWVPRSSDDIPYTILGRDYVFKRFEISFHEGRRKIAFKRT